MNLGLYLLFVVAALALNVTPGPDMLYVFASAGRAGRRAGVVAALGIGLGEVVHTGAAALGFSAVLMSSAAAFSFVKYLGAAYLLWLGLRALFAPSSARPPGEAAPPRSGERVLVRAVVTSVLNPKVAIFFLAFVPQFADASRGHLPLQFLVLGLTFCTTSTLVNAAVGLLAGSLRGLLQSRTS